MAEKMSRTKKQAIYEINVVKSCRENYLEKLEEIKKKTEEISAQIGVLIERGRLSSNVTEQKELAREIKKLRDNFEILKDDQSCFQDNVDMFDELETLLNSFFIHERFRYIVRKIPEKRLPIMVKDPDKREEVNELLLSLLGEFNNSWKKYLLNMEKRKEERERMRKTKDIFRERNETSDKEIDSIMDEFKSDNATEALEDISTEMVKRKNFNS